MENEENYEGIKPFSGQNQPWAIRLLPDEARLICYTQVKFNGEDKRYNYYPDKILYVRLERPIEYPLCGEKTLYAVMANVKYLNPDLSKSELTHWCGYISRCHFITPFDSKTVSTVANWAMNKYIKGQLIPRGQDRSIIFNPGFSLTKKEKLRIVGQLTKRTGAITEDIIYDCIEQMQSNPSPFTIHDIARSLGVSVSTIARNITPILRNYMNYINNTIRDNRDLMKLKTAVKHYDEQGIKYKVSDIRKACGFSGVRLKYIKNIMDGQ